MDHQHISTNWSQNNMISFEGQSFKWTEIWRKIKTTAFLKQKNKTSVSFENFTP